MTSSCMSSGIYPYHPCPPSVKPQLLSMKFPRFHKMLLSKILITSTFLEQCFVLTQDTSFPRDLTSLILVSLVLQLFDYLEQNGQNSLTTKQWFQFIVFSIEISEFKISLVHPGKKFSSWEKRILEDLLQDTE